MAQRGFTFVLDARDATNAFKDLEHGFRRSHRAASEFGNILGGLSSEMGDFGKAFGAVGAALASGSAWGAAAAGVMLIVDHFKEAGRAAKESAAEMGKLGDKVFELSAKLAGLDPEEALARGRIAAFDRMDARRKEAEAARLARLRELGAASDEEVSDEKITRLNAEIKGYNAMLEPRRAAVNLLREEVGLTKQLAEAKERKALEPLDPSQAGEMANAYRKGADAVRELRSQTNPLVNTRAWESPLIDPKKMGPDQGTEKRLREAKELGDLMERLQKTGDAVSQSFANLGEAFGGSAGKMLAAMGNLITKAVQLAIAMTATGGPFAWVNLPATLAAITAVIAAVPQFRAGGGYVGAGQPYVVGEAGPELFVPGMNGAIVPNRALGGLTVNISAAALDQTWWDRHQGEVLRTLSKAAGNRRRG